MITMDCPHCAIELHIDDKYAGQSGNCMHCQKRISVPAQNTQKEVPPVMQGSLPPATAPKASMPPGEVVITTRNTLSLTLGIISVVVGALALLLGWVPYIGLLAVPFAMIGALFASIGVVIGLLKRLNGLGMPMLGGALCIGAVYLSVLSTVKTSMVINEAIEDVSHETEQRDREGAQTSSALTGDEPAIPRVTNKDNIEEPGIFITGREEQISQTGEALEFDLYGAISIGRSTATIYNYDNYDWINIHIIATSGIFGYYDSYMDHIGAGNSVTIRLNDLTSMNKRFDPTRYTVGEMVVTATWPDGSKGYLGVRFN